MEPWCKELPYENIEKWYLIRSLLYLPPGDHNGTTDELGDSQKYIV